jgi:two-component system, cell cycle sensor histidine kinase and response regulator CckA
MSDTGSCILIVDDEPPLLRMMSLYLERKGYHVTVAGSAAKARSELAAAPGRYEVVVLDATLPGTTLTGFAGEILASEPAVRVLAASGYPIDMSALEVAAPGRVAFLHKPFSPEMLATVVRRLLGKEEESL